MQFGVQLDVYRGPLDLLLFLVRKHELDALDIPIALVTDQYLEHLDILEQIDVNAVGDFVDMASTLIEIKSRMVLPSGDEVEEAIEDPRSELVSRLLAYKEYRDAACVLEERGKQSQLRFARVSNDLPQREFSIGDQPIREVELWDLVSSLGRILKQSRATQPANIVYDDTPIHVYMQRIHKRVLEEREVRFVEFFEATAHKSTIVSIFLAILEMVRHQLLCAGQNELFGDIVLTAGPNIDAPITAVDNYEHAQQQ